MRQIVRIAATALACVTIAASPAYAVYIETITFSENGAPGGSPTVTGLYPVGAFPGQPPVPITTGPEFASGPIELSSPGPGPIEPTSTTAAVMLLDPVTSLPSDLVVFESGPIVEEVHPYQINMISFYSAAAAACPDLTGCIPAGVTPVTATETGAAQDITSLFAPTFDLSNISNTIGYSIVIASPEPAVPEPPSADLLAIGVAAIAGVGTARRRRADRRLGRATGPALPGEDAHSGA